MEERNATAQDGGDATELRGKHRKTIPLAAIIVTICGFLTAVAFAGIFVMQLNQGSSMINQAAEMSLDTLRAHVSDMDRAMENIEAYMHEVFFGNADVEALSRSNDETSSFHSKQRVARTLNHIVRLGSMVECAWIYVPSDYQDVFLARSSPTGISNAELLQIRERIIGIIERNSRGAAEWVDRWSLISTEASDYLLWIIPTADVYYGAWVRVSYLHSKFSGVFLQHDGSELIFSTHDGRQLTESDLDYRLTPESLNWGDISGDKIGMTVFSSRADLAVSAALSKSSILKDADFGFDFSLFAAGMLVTILLAVLVNQYFMYRPFFRLNQALGEISGGNMDIRVKERSRLREISVLEHSVNHLLDVISDLKISVYETQLLQRNTACQYLKVRLKTHFYINCLSIIHAMACVKKTELIKEMTMKLSSYLRFLDKDTDELVQLEDELSHIRNYARIQELRFPGVFQYIEDVPLELHDEKVPALVLHTFIENSVEHAMRRDYMNWVRLRADYEVRGDLPGIRYRVTDSGKGFDGQILQELSATAMEIDFTRSESIGIRNVISRLALLYDGKACISFSNSEDCGAAVEIWLPTI